MFNIHECADYARFMHSLLSKMDTEFKNGILPFLLEQMILKYLTFWCFFKTFLEILRLDAQYFQTTLPTVKTLLSTIFCKENFCGTCYLQSLTLFKMIKRAL
jgi:hypothetical protein